MSDIEQYAHYRGNEHVHRISQKEISGMVGDDNSMLAQQYGSNNQRFGNANAGDNQSEAILTLTHRFCYELKQTGTRLIHKACHERPYRLCPVHKH